jgi:hypothetical protein
LDQKSFVRDSRGEKRSALNKKRIALLERRSNLNKNQITRIAQLTLTAVAALTLAGNTEARNHPSSKIILLRPADLPELARVPGQAMLLHATGDGRTHLYVEQNDGALLAIFDVTDAAHVKEEGSAYVDAPYAFDFVSSLGDYAELVRFRNGQGEAVLNLHKAKVPTLNAIQGLDIQGPAERLGDDGLVVADQPNAQSDANDPNYQVVDLSNPLHPAPVGDINQVTEKLTNDETGTTFLLAVDGLYLIRRPAVEEEYEIHQWQLSHPG